MKLMHAFALVPTSLVAVSCDDGGGTEEVSLAADACEHFEGGPGDDATAGATAAEAGDVGAEHTAWTITMPTAAAGPRVGFVSLAIDAAGDHTFFFDTDVTVVMSDAGGAPIAPESSTSVEADCTLVKRALTYELGVGTYTLQITTDSGEVSLVWLGAEHDHEHE